MFQLEKLKKLNFLGQKITKIEFFPISVDFSVKVTEIRGVEHKIWNKIRSVKILNLLIFFQS